MEIRSTEGVAFVSGEGLLLTDTQSALDLVMTVRYETGCDCVVLPQSAIHEDFFVLSTGLAGEVLQKFVNYRCQLAIVGDFSQVKSKPLRDFIRESNRGSHICFVSTEQEALAWMTKGHGRQ